MNNPPQLRTQFQQIIVEKSRKFINYEFIFNIFKNFIDKYKRGYLIIVGSPGSGKSAILANFVSSNQNSNINIIYYNAQLEGKNRAVVFLNIFFA